MVGFAAAMVNRSLYFSTFLNATKQFANIPLVEIQLSDAFLYPAVVTLTAANLSNAMQRAMPFVSVR